MIQYDITDAIAIYKSFPGDHIYTTFGNLKLSDW